MKKIRISGLGMISQAGITAENFWDQICSGTKVTLQKEEIAFRTSYPASKLRRTNRYCKMALYASEQAWKDANISDAMDAFDKGTIFVTGYGAMSAQVKFCREVVKGDPDFCSPTVFTGTVPNSCVGTVCMFLQCKGVSTMLSGGNYLEYSSLLLKNKQAEVILAGAVEEYTPELFEGLTTDPVNNGVSFSEGSVVCCLEYAEENRGYGFLERTGSIGLPGNPFLGAVDEETAICRMKEFLKGFTEDMPDLVLGAQNGSCFDKTEIQVLEEVFGKERVGGSVKALTGETLGCGFSMSVAVAALCLKHGKVPASLSGCGKDIDAGKILVTGYDSIGNYMCALVGR